MSNAIIRGDVGLGVLVDTMHEVVALFFESLTDGIQHAGYQAMEARIG